MKKKLLFLALFFALNNILLNAQTSEKKIIRSCVKSSCCDLYFFSIDVFSETTCHTIITNKVGDSKDYVSIKLETKDNKIIKELVLEQDRLLPNMLNDKGEALIIPKGRYYSQNNEFLIETTTSRVRNFCYIRESYGTILGVSVATSIKVCVIYGIVLFDFTKMSNQADVVLTIDKEIIDKYSKDGFLIFDKDFEVTLENEGKAYKSIIKAGKYLVSDDSNIYFKNVIFESK